MDAVPRLLSSAGNSCEHGNTGCGALVPRKALNSHGLLHGAFFLATLTSQDLHVTSVCPTRPAHHPTVSCEGQAQGRACALTQDGRPWAPGDRVAD